MIFFWILWAIDALVSFVLFYFFFEGMSDHSMSADKVIVWFVILAAVGTITLDSLRLRSAGKLRLAIGILLIVAIPALLYGVFLAIILTINPWQ